MWTDHRVIYSPTELTINVQIKNCDVNRSSSDLQSNWANN